MEIEKSEVKTKLWGAYEAWNYLHHDQWIWAAWFL